jgi:hypothetical protein
VKAKKLLARLRSASTNSPRSAARLPTIAITWQRQPALL